MERLAEVGDTIEVNRYCYTKRNCGTRIANEQITCKIVRRWYDYECGWKYHAVPADPYLLSRKDAHSPEKKTLYTSMSIT